MGIRVMVIDDTDHVRRMLVQMLELSGFEIVAEAASGEEAMTLIAKADPQVVVVDYKMPGMTGFQVLEQAREIHPDIASVLVTGHGTPEVMKEAAKMSFDAILLKPFTSNELRTTVDQVLRGRG